MERSARTIKQTSKRCTGCLLCAAPRSWLVPQGREQRVAKSIWPTPFISRLRAA